MLDDQENQAGKAGKKGRLTMHTLPQTASDTLPAPQEAFAEAGKRRNAEDLAYQGLTVAAIVLLLCSLWVF